MDLESEALREAYASAPADRVVLDTLEVSRPGQSSIFLTNNFHPFTAYLEDNTTQVTFLAIPFQVKLPSKSRDELPTLSVTIANPNQLVSTYLYNAKIEKQVVTVKFRPYLATASGAPTAQLPVPMTFSVGPWKNGIGQVELQCTFPDIANQRFPNENYTIRNFPGLRGW